MATVIFIPEAKQSPSAMHGLITYCLQDQKVNDAVSGRRLVSGINCNGENAFKEFMATKIAYSKTDRINFYQYVQSFSPRENVDAQTAHKIAVEFASKAWAGHEVLVTTHTDAEHIHSHFVVNSVGFEDGYKLRQSPNTLRQLRGMSDLICQAHGLQTLKPYTGGGSKMTAREYHAAMKGESWKFKLIATINTAMNKSGSRAEFIEQMNRHGYQVLWTEERKNITFTCPNGKKCRDKMLHDEKYLKEFLEYELQFRERHYKHRKEFGGTTDREELGRYKRNEDRPNARDGSDTGKGLGYNGRSSANGSEFSAEGFQTVGNFADDIEYGNADGRMVSSGTGEFQQGSRNADGQTENTADGGGEHNAPNGVPRRTGWEESRKHYERYLGQGFGFGNGDSESIGQDRQTNLEDSHGDIGGRIGVVGGIINPALRSIAGITDGSEDPEERKRRIEAEQNASNLGAVIGAAVGIALTLADNVSDDSEDELPEDLQSEQAEITLQM